MENIVKVNDYDITLTASIVKGKRCYHETNSLQALLQLADTALYKAKSNGKNCEEIATIISDEGE